MAFFPCPYLNAAVELTDEREKHIADHHPDLLPAFRDELLRTISDPDLIRRSVRDENARLFARWFEGLGQGKHIVVVVVSEGQSSQRHWIITAYIARSLAGGVTEWTRS